MEDFPPESGLEIVSVPYSLYAEKALGVSDGGVSGAAIARKSITMDHLADGFVEQFAGEMTGGVAIATVTDLSSLQTTYRSTSGASSIGVSSGFVYSGSNNVQQVLQDIDRAVQHRQASIDTEATTRQAADTTLQTNINTVVGANRRRGSGFGAGRLDHSVL